MSHTLAIVTVVYRNYTILHDYFSSFDTQTDHGFHIYIVDLSEKKQDYEYPNYVTYIKGNNRGYAHGINLGIAQAMDDGYDYLCAMNCDVEVKADFVSQVKKAIHTHSSSLIGGKIYYGKGYEYHKDRYLEQDRGHVLWYAGGICDWKNSVSIHRGVDEIDRGQYDKEERTDFITGCLMCYHRRVVQRVGPWDEKYFLYYEDADYCERAKRAHIKLIYDPTIVLWHKNAQSTGGSGSGIHTAYQEKNKVRFGLKYAPLRTKLHLIKNYLSDFLNSICKCDQ